MGLSEPGWGGHGIRRWGLSGHTPFDLGFGACDFIATSHISDFLYWDPEPGLGIGNLAHSLAW